MQRDNVDVTYLGHRLRNAEQVEGFTAQFLSGTGDRWKHTQAVGRKAEKIGIQLGLDEWNSTRLTNAAWMHDIGYVFKEYHSWHPIAGAMYLQSVELDSIANLVAWHSTAEYESKLLGFEMELLAWHHEDSDIQDALDFCDMTTGPSGQDFMVAERQEEVGERHGRTSPQYLAMGMALPRLQHIELRLNTLN